jgi:uncharacterized protein
MQNLRDIAQQVESVYVEMSATFNAYQQRRKLYCRAGCGRCCRKPDVYVTALEMLPLALHWYDSGQAETLMQEIENYQGQFCFFYDTQDAAGENGQCRIYDFRGGICRMFGATGHPDKYGALELSTCQPIREDHPQAYDASIIAIAQDPPPLMKHWKSQVTNIDYELAREELPLTEAVRQALLKVLVMASYAEVSKGTHE